MKNSSRFFILSVLVCLPAVVRADGVPPGFDAPGLMDRVMNGEIVLDETVNTDTEFQDYFRAFFDKTTPAAYGALVTDYEIYPQLFDNMKDGKTTSVNADHTVYTYTLTVEESIGPFTETVYPEGQETLQLTPDANGESHILNEITNYQNNLNYATETVRLIPYQTGMLVEDDVHVSIKNSSPATGMVKSQLQKQFQSYLSVFREHLQGKK